MNLQARVCASFSATVGSSTGVRRGDAAEALEPLAAGVELVQLEDQVAGEPVDLVDRPRRSCSRDSTQPAELAAGERSSLPLLALKTTVGDELAVDRLVCAAPTPRLVGADDQRLGADVDVDDAVVLLDRLDVDELARAA